MMRRNNDTNLFEMADFLALSTQLPISIVSEIQWKLYTRQKTWSQFNWYLNFSNRYIVDWNYSLAPKKVNSKPGQAERNMAIIKL